VTGDGALERRYRLLLSCYPRSHRAEYGEEMLGVLLAPASGGPDGGRGRRAGRWPAPVVAADLLVGAARAWLRWGSERAASSRWAAVAAVLGVALPFAMALASVPAYPAIVVNWSMYVHHWQPFVDPQPMLSGWAVVFALSFTRLRRLTAVAAWLCALPQLLLAALLVLPALPDATGLGTRLCWPALSLLAAVALTVPAARKPGVASQGTASQDAGRVPAARVGGAARLGPVGTGLLLATALDFVLWQPVSYPVDPRVLATAARSVAGPVGWWVLAAVGVAVPLVAVVLLARRVGLPGTLRAVGAGAGIGVLFLGGGRFADLLLSVSTSLPVYGVGRWIVGPLLAFTLPVLAARRLERRAAAARR
jgi:hypothetical protein